MSIDDEVQLNEPNKLNLGLLAKRCARNYKNTMQVIDDKFIENKPIKAGMKTAATMLAPYYLIGETIDYLIFRRKEIEKLDATAKEKEIMDSHLAQSFILASLNLGSLYNSLEELNKDLNTYNNKLNTAESLALSNYRAQQKIIETRWDILLENSDMGLPQEKQEILIALSKKEQERLLLFYPTIKIYI